MLYFELKSEDESSVLPYFGSDLILIALTQREMIIFIFFKLCLPDNETQLKIIPNRKLAVFKDVIKDTNNRHA